MLTDLRVLAEVDQAARRMAEEVVQRGAHGR
jgi:hypothetical protein